MASLQAGRGRTNGSFSIRLARSSPPTPSAQSLSLRAVAARAMAAAACLSRACSRASPSLSMASPCPQARMKPPLERNPTRKRHSWWWNSHISPKNSKWLAENLEEMDKQVKEMLQLIEEDGDSFAKRAQMYYQRRPMLITHGREAIYAYMKRVQQKESFDS